MLKDYAISIHAPSRERLTISSLGRAASSNFNPRSLTGATLALVKQNLANAHFNPRSLTGATQMSKGSLYVERISIHAPSRERRRLRSPYSPQQNFNPRSLTGATGKERKSQVNTNISIHAPSRERLWRTSTGVSKLRFQSTLPHGSDQRPEYLGGSSNNFNPRSLTGATRISCANVSLTANFNPRSLTGATPGLMDHF